MRGRIPCALLLGGALVACTAAPFEVTTTDSAVLDSDPASGDSDDSDDTDAPVDTVQDDSDVRLPPPVDDEPGCDSDVDLMSDPLNCGVCGRTCVLPHAEAGCDQGACVPATCDRDFADCDGDPVTGCEEPVTCDDTEACTSTCGTTGRISCADPCTPVCAAPAEVCNALDDDCDGACDQGGIPGCRVAVHRAHGSKGHLFTTSLSEAQGWGTLESQANFHLYASPTADLRPWFRCADANGGFWASESNDCEGTGGPRSTLGFIAPEPAAGSAATCGAVPLHRLYNPGSKHYFYTLSAAERDNAVNALGWESQGLAGYVWRTP